MAQYTDVIGGLTDGVGVPAGFENRWGTTGDVSYAVSDDAAAPNGKKLTVDQATNGRQFIGFNGVNSDSDRGTANVAMLVRPNYNEEGPLAGFGGPVVRGSYPSASERGLVGVLRRNSGAKLGNYEYNSAGLDPQEANSSWEQGVPVWIDVSVSETTFTVTFYENDNDAYGAQIGQRVRTGALASNADNWIGIFSFAQGSMDVLYMSIGTGADSAPMPGTVVTPVDFTGTVPTLNGTEGTAFSSDLSAYFSGTETPFTYSVQTGALPSGLDLNTSTGVISGTPTTAGTASGIVIRATDSATNFADTNSFSIEITATGVLSLRNDLPFRDSPTTLTNDTAVTITVLTNAVPPVVAGQYTADIVSGYASITDTPFDTVDAVFKMVVEKTTFSRTAAAKVVSS